MSDVPGGSDPRTLANKDRRYKHNRGRRPENAHAPAKSVQVRDLSWVALCALEAADRTGGLTEAALAEGVPRSSITQLIARLELELDIALLDTAHRDHRRKVLTKEAKRLAEVTRNFRHELQAELDRLKASADQRRYRARRAARDQLTTATKGTSPSEIPREQDR